MEPMQTLDRNYLASHPEGDEKARITMSVPIGPEFNIPANPDGTPATISIGVTAENYLSALAALGHHHERVDELILVWLCELLTPEQIEAVNQLPDDAEDVPYVEEASNRIHHEYLTFATNAEITRPGTEEKEEVLIAIKAPSLTTGLMAFTEATTPRALTNLAIGLCPETGEPAGSSEVLVRLA